MQEIKEFLTTRRSTKIKHIVAPAPTGEELQTILQTAARVPDHGKLNPWYFIVFERDNRAEFGKKLRLIWAKNHPDCTEEQLNHEENRFTRAPLVVAVISRIRESTIPQWEQILSAGACCYNLCLACNAHGYGANWLSEWYSFDDEIRASLNLEDTRDHVAGFIYIGTETEKNIERPRPDMAHIINHWTKDNIMDKKGGIYNKDGLPMPRQGFKLYAEKSSSKD